jgi:hypothetical protein
LRGGLVESPDRLAVPADLREQPPFPMQQSRRVGSDGEQCIHCVQPGLIVPDDLEGRGVVDRGVIAGRPVKQYPIRAARLFVLARREGPISLLTRGIRFLGLHGGKQDPATHDEESNAATVHGGHRNG